MISPKFPEDYLRAYCEHFDVSADLVHNDGAEFATRYINTNTGKPSETNFHCWHFVHTVAELREAELEAADDVQSHFTCSKGILWSIHPL